MALKLTGGIASLVDFGGNTTSSFIVSFTGTTGELELDGPQTLCKASELPGIKVNTTDVFWKGVKYPVKREAQHNQTIDLTFYQDAEDTMRYSFMKWAGLAFDDTPKEATLYITQGAKSIGGASDSVEYNMDNVRTVELKNVYPTNVGDIKLAYDKAGEIAEYTVTFSYSQF